jgi:hypothetical protein
MLKYQGGERCLNVALAWLLPTPAADTRLSEFIVNGWFLLGGLERYSQIFSYYTVWLTVILRKW